MCSRLLVPPKFGMGVLEFPTFLAEGDIVTESHLQHKIWDDIIQFDEHSAILFANGRSKREQLDRRFEYTLGMRNKPTFMAHRYRRPSPVTGTDAASRPRKDSTLRTRKQQDAENPSLAGEHPASTVFCRHNGKWYQY